MSAAALGVALLALSAAPIGASPRVCPTLDGRYDVDAGEWEGGVQPEGISIVSASDDEVVFTITEGFTLTGLCVKTGSQLNQYDMDAELPVVGAATVTVTKAGQGLGIGHLSFDSGITTVTCPEVDAPSITFEKKQYIDSQRAGGEPVSVVAQDGSINVSAHAGTTHIYKNPSAAPGARDFALGYWNQTLNWRSTDGGRHWEYIGILGQREGPHTLTSTGFSDPDYAIDQAGNIYNVEIDLANDAVYKSPDDGQSYPQGHPFVRPGDRPWVTALEANEVFLYVNSLPKSWSVSRDGGLTWELLPTPPTTGDAYPDPLNPDDGLIAPAGSSVGTGRIAISANDGLNWTLHPGARLGPSEDIYFPVNAVDRAGNVYAVTAGGYNGGTDVNPNGQVSYAYFDRTTLQWNPQRIDIPIPAGDALWPWVTAGDDGRVAVVWLQTLAGSPREFYVYAAVTKNGRGTTVTCSDGSTKFIPPQFTVVNASGTPVHVGAICLSGTSCNANPNFENGDRRLGDFFTVNHDLEGNIFIVTADTMSKNPLGGPKPVGNPIIIRQDLGDRLLEEPIPARPSRCLWPVMLVQEFCPR